MYLEDKIHAIKDLKAKILICKNQILQPSTGCS